MNDVITGIFFVIGSLAALAIAIFMVGVKDVIVGRKTIDYSLVQTKKMNDEFLASLTDDVDQHAATTPGMQFFQYNN